MDYDILNSITAECPSDCSRGDKYLQFSDCQTLWWSRSSFTYSSRGLFFAAKENYTKISGNQRLRSRAPGGKSKEKKCCNIADYIETNVTIFLYILEEKALQIRYD